MSTTNFWKNLKKPIFALAPMEDVTDCAFREMFAKYGKPSVLYTEFVSTEGLMHPEGRKKLIIDLKFTEIQRPIVAQIWGTDPQKFQGVAEYLDELGFDGIDINMGCPQSKEIQAGACAALMRDHDLAIKIIKATQKGAGKLPVSVKTRLGYSRIGEMEDWIKVLLDTEIKELTLHGRTKQEMSKVPAHWDKIAEAVKIRDAIKSETLILGNGDVLSREDGLNKIKMTGVDGVMVGRATFGNPWFFQGSPSEAQNIEKSSSTRAALETRLAVMLEHAELFQNMFTGIKSFTIMRKHFKAYCSGFEGAAELRAKLMEAKDLEETKAVVKAYLK
jgi:nifR3 family TIM-barrel protein